jgi:hypothetical protein
MSKATKEGHAEQDDDKHQQAEKQQDRNVPGAVAACQEQAHPKSKRNYHANSGQQEFALKSFRNRQEQRRHPERRGGSVYLPQSKLIAAAGHG